MTQPVPQPRRAEPATRDIVVGATVYGADNGRFGQVAGSYRNFLIVERGFFMPVDYYVPMSAISRVEGDLVVLSVSRDAALTQGWERPPFTSETGQRGVRRPTVGRAGPATPANQRGEQPATSPAAAAASWPATPSRSGQASGPAASDVAGATTPPTGNDGPETTRQPADHPVIDPAGAVPAKPAARPTAIPATGPFADTYAVGTNTESYHAMTGFPADPVSPSPGQSGPAGEASTPIAAEAESSATQPSEPAIAAAGPATGEDADSARVSGEASASGPNRPAPPDAEAPAPADVEAPVPADTQAAAPPPVERPAP